MKTWSTLESQLEITKRANMEVKVKDRMVQYLVEYVSERTNTFGGGKTSPWGNPIAAAMSGGPPTFALGVSVEEVVRLVLAGIDIEIT